MHISSRERRDNLKQNKNGNKTSKSELDMKKDGSSESSISVNFSELISSMENIKNENNNRQDTLVSSLNTLETTNKPTELNKAELLEKEKHIEFLDVVISKPENKTGKISSTGPKSILMGSSSETKYYLNYEGKLSVSKVKLDDFTSSLRSNEHEKIDIVTSILDGILFKMEDKGPTATVLNTSSPTVFHSKYVNIKDRIEWKQEVIKSYEEKVSIERGIETFGSERIPVISSVVRHLGLPINVSKQKTYAGVKANYDKILTEKDPEEETTLFERKGIKTEKYSEEREEIDTSNLVGKEHLQCSPFELKWCFGFNPEIPVLNLSTGNKSLIMFASSQFSVLYDFHEETMSFMQGHINEVSCIACDLMGSYMVSADIGYNSQVLIWNSKPCIVEVLRHVHPRGTQLVGLSGAGDYLITISPMPQQNVQLWIWQQNTSQPAAERGFNEYLGQIKKLTMNPTCAEEFALTFETGVSFVYFEKEKTANGNGELQCDTHIIPAKLGLCTGTTFLSEQYAAALTSTSHGYVFMWVEESQHKKSYEKHVRLEKGGITHITAVDNVVALVSDSGEISFYSSSLLILYWTTKLKRMGPLVSFSFNISEDEGTLLCEHEAHRSCVVDWRKDDKLLTDASIKPKPFSCRDIVISTMDGRLGFFNVTTDSLKFLLYPSNAVYTAIDVMPDRHYLCAGTSSGHVLLIDLKDNKIKSSQKIATPADQCQAVAKLQYSSSGFLLACGMYTGAVWMLDNLLLTPLHPVPLSRSTHCITHLTFSPDSDYLAVADTGLCVTLYDLIARPPVFVGQFQAHLNTIQDVFFGSLDSKALKLFTLGADRIITEFEINLESNNVVYKTIHRVEQSAVPHCIVPNLNSDSHHLMVNSELKFKLLDSQTLKCCKTFQAPDFGSDICNLEPLNQNCLIFWTAHHIGLQMMPIDGNPYKSLGTRCSFTPIVSCKFHSNGRYLFVISENCTAINMWKINQSALEDWHEVGGRGLDPFLKVLEGGKGGWREKDLREFFLVGQFMQQGEKPSITRTLSNSVSISQVISIYQALGFFPTQYQIDNMMLEMQGSENCPLQPPSVDQRITFDDLVRLYVNHRPTKDMTVEELRQAFLLMYQSVEGNSYVPKDNEVVFDSAAFMEKLSDTGEGVPLEKLYSYLSVLTLGKEMSQNLIKKQSVQFLPKRFSFEGFVTEVLGFKTNNPVTFSRDS